MNLYLWYSLDAYKCGVPEYIYIDDLQQVTIYNLITDKKNVPHDSKYKDYVLVCGPINIDPNSISGYYIAADGNHLFWDSE